ncbi:lmo0937 family membrane protein [Bacillus lacus]|uniref:Lmo0937 family membrane protein n=1 Tax=Metabacillus lacus TaxID=1983721 RepID=A0A7X2IY35_9BACI|nr:lmo0937 family membrane protein [Metabacillus lacus]MRX71925.1 lmo0937 family membrane protein [Metabacillus lacus]
MLWTIISVLIIFWLIGFALDLIGGLIHIILIVAAVLFIMRVIKGRRSAAR